jgi:hypothetical protein
MLAYRQVQTAGYWVSQDALQAQNVAVTGFLVLEWTDWDDAAHSITYTLEDMPSGGLKYLQREETIETTDGTTTRTTMAGQYLDAGTTDCAWNSTAKMLTFTVKAQLGGETATRTYEVKPRSVS